MYKLASVLSLAAAALACGDTVTTSSSNPAITSAPSTTTCTNFICRDYINSCGQTYGGCYSDCPGSTTPIFTDPGCPTTTASSSSLSTSTTSCGYICKDYFDDCGNTYGPGCYQTCSPEPSYTTPLCTVTSAAAAPTTTAAAAAVAARAATGSCGFICRDYVDECGNTYGPGCYTTCAGQSTAVPSFTTPYCDATPTAA